MSCRSCGRSPAWAPPGPAADRGQAERPSRARPQDRFPPAAPSRRHRARPKQCVPGRASRAGHEHARRREGRSGWPLPASPTRDHGRHAHRCLVGRGAGAAVPSISDATAEADPFASNDTAGAAVAVRPDRRAARAPADRFDGLSDVLPTAGQGVADVPPRSFPERAGHMPERGQSSPLFPVPGHRRGHRGGPHPGRLERARARGGGRRSAGGRDVSGWGRRSSRRRR